MAETENHTLALLREIRGAIDDLDQKLTRDIDDLRTRVDGNTLILNMVAGVVQDHDTRIERLEETCLTDS